MKIQKFPCPVCRTAIEAPPTLERCPACKEYIADRLPKDSKENLETQRALGRPLDPWVYEEQD